MSFEKQQFFDDPLEKRIDIGGCPLKKNSILMLEDVFPLKNSILRLEDGL